MDCQKIIQTEVDKLLAIEFIKEVNYPDWLANVVVIPKKKKKESGEFTLTTPT